MALVDWAVVRQPVHLSITGLYHPLDDGSVLIINFPLNILRKSLTIAFLVVSIFESGLNIDPVGAQNTVGDKKLVLELTDEERAWITDANDLSINVG